MEDRQVPSEKLDIVVIGGTPELKIDIISNELLEFLEGYEYVPRIHVKGNNLSLDGIIEDSMKNKKKLIINCDLDLSCKYADCILKVLLVTPEEEITDEQKSHYYCVIDIANMSDIDIVSKVVAAQWRWIEGRPFEKLV